MPTPEGREIADLGRVEGRQRGRLLGVASDATSALAVSGLWIEVATGWAWLAAVSVHLHRRIPHPTRPRV